MANHSGKVGGISALIASATVIVGLGMFATMLSDYASGDPTPSESIAFLVDNQAALYIWNLITLIVFSVVLVPLALALYSRLKERSGWLAPTGTAFGMIWAGILIGAGMLLNIGAGTIVDLAESDPAQAESLWLAVDSVGNGLSGGMEIVGPIWILLISLAALKAGTLPKALNYLGVVISAAGLVTIVPALETVGAIFGLGLIIWLAWLGFVMLREQEAPLKAAPAGKAG